MTDDEKRKRIQAYKKEWQVANKARIKVQRAAFRAANKERIRAAKAADYASNKERIKARVKAHADANKERIKAENAIRYLVNKERDREKRAAAGRAYYAANKERSFANTLAWRNANKDASRSIVRNRRARQRAAEGTHDANDIARIRKMQKDRCAYCHTKLSGGGHVDHIVALSKGGTNWPSNLQITCGSCNNSKHAKDPAHFARLRGLLL